MSYLLDKKKKKNKIINLLIIILFLMLVVYFNKGIHRGLSKVSHFIFRPFVSLGNSIKEKTSNLGIYFSSKRNLQKENEELKNNLERLEADFANNKNLEDENSKLKEIFNRKTEHKELILGVILSKPNVSLYDTLIIDLGQNDGVGLGNLVFAYGNIPIGKISEIYSHTSKVVLFSTPGEKNEVVISGRDTYMTLIGRGGGNFEITLPRDFIIENGTSIHLPGVNSYIIGTVETIISDPRDSFKKALVVSPVNIQEVKFVEVEK